MNELPIASPGYVPDPTALRALAHPLRLQLLDALAVRGQATASQLAEDLAESSGATSYHLRQLARHGFIEEVAGLGTTRERWWRPISGGWTLPVSMQRTPGPEGLIAGSVTSSMLETSHQRAMGFVRSLMRWPLRWQRAVARQQAHLELAPEQLVALGLEMEALIDRYRGLPPGADGRRSGSRCWHIRWATRPATTMRELGGRFWRLLSASAASNLADGIGRAALPLLAATLTRDPLLISGLYSLAFLPWLLFALPAGALVDRSDRRRAMVLGNAVRAVVVAALAVAAATGHASIGLLYVVAFVLGAAETVYDSAANAMLPQVVGPGQLDRGNSLLVTGEAVGQVFLGGPVGALLFTLAVAAPLYANAAGFAICALIMATVAGTYRPALASTSSLRTDIREGVRWMLGHPLLRGLTFTYGLTSAFHAMAMSMLVLYALETLRVTEVAYGLLLLAGGIGGLLGGLVAPWAGARLGRTRALVVVAVVGPFNLVGLALVDEPFAAAALLGLGGSLIMVGNVLTMSLRQTLIPEELFGRVQGAWRTLVWGGIPVGGVAGGVLAAVAGIPAVFMVAGVGNLLVGLAIARLLHANRSLLT